ncbi:unnamed protein product [marine sediment metagenome]|uniref:YCII-related domain-containing protein n=1 Tax=marine sediment metagenome TaxID=412755 RepID=X1PRL6_9ZZZZ
MAKSEVWGVVLEDRKTNERMKPMSVLAGNYIEAIEKAKDCLPKEEEEYRVVKVERLVEIIV